MGGDLWRAERKGSSSRTRITLPIGLETFVCRLIQYPPEPYTGFKPVFDRKAALTVSLLSRRCVQTPCSFSMGNDSGSSKYCHPLGVTFHFLRYGASGFASQTVWDFAPPYLSPLCCGDAWRNRGLRRIWRRTDLMSGAMKKLAQPQ